MPHDDDDQFLAEAPVGINFDEEATKFFDRRADDRGLFITERTLLAGMRVQPRDRKARGSDPELSP